MEIREYHYTDFFHGLFECLEQLSEMNPVKTHWYTEVARARKKLGIRTYVAEHYGVIVGTITVILEPKFIHAGSYVGRIEDVAVHPEHQGKGIGKLLINYALGLCSALNCYKVVLCCSEKNEGFYEKLGFRANEREMRMDLDTNGGDRGLLHDVQSR